jgi:hypothetical protein
MEFDYHLDNYEITMKNLFNGIFTIYIYGDEPDLRYTKPMYKLRLNLCLIQSNRNKWTINWKPLVQYE